MECGDEIPEFGLPDENGDTFRSGLLRGIRYILYIYPSDTDRDSVSEAVDLNGLYPRLMIRNIPVLGISPDSRESHAKLMISNGLKIKLLSDAGHSAISLLGAWDDAVGQAVRTTFIVGKDGKIEAVWHNVNTEGHADQVYATIRSLSK
jgi:thioredoxin-dependent peroxiredoxin